MNKRTRGFMCLLVLGGLLQACGQPGQKTPDQESVQGRQVPENDVMYRSLHPEGQKVQLRVTGQEKPVEAVLSGDQLRVGDMVFGQLRGHQVIGAGGQVLLELGADHQIRPMGAGNLTVPSRKWPGGVIPYVIDASVSAGSRDAFEAARAEFHNRTKIRIVPRTTEANYIRVLDSNTNACLSYVGMIGGEQRLELAPRCDATLARHELLHALGIGHEQTRQDRDQHVIVNGPNENLDTSYAGTPIGAYDFQSNVHSINFFYSDRGWDFVPKNGFPPELVGYNQLQALSTGDLITIQAIYPELGPEVGMTPGQLVSFQVTTPNYTTRYLRHAFGLARTDVVEAGSDGLLKDDASFIIRQGLSNPGCYSFEARNVAGAFLRHQDYRLKLATNDNSDLLRNDATFCPKAGVRPGSVKLESFNMPGYFIRHADELVYAARADGPNPWDGGGSFNDDISWNVAPAWNPRR